MSAPTKTVVLPSTPATHQVGVVAGNSTLWTRISNYVSEHKVAVFTAGAFIVVAGAGGIYYYRSAADKPAGDKDLAQETKKEARKRKSDRKKKENEKEEKGKPEGRVARESCWERD